MKHQTLIIIFLIFLTSCISPPSEPEDNGASQTGDNGVFILCEGIWKQNNSSLSYYDRESGKMTNDFYKKMNPGLNLGDLANDLAIKGDTAFIAVSTSKTIELFRISTGKSLDRIVLHGHHQPRELCIVGDRAYVTDLYDSSVTAFNTKSMTITNRGRVGSAPEGIAAHDDYLYVANSGYGDYLADRPKAGTISVLDLNSRLREKKLLEAGPNVTELQVNPLNGRLYALYLHLPSKEDSLGGIVEYDASSHTELRRWHLDAKAMQLSVTGDTLFFFHDNDLAMLDLRQQSPTPKKLIDNPNNNEIWYSLGVDPDGRHLWIGSAMNYQVHGEVYMYDLNDLLSPEKTFKVGINPGTIRFF